MKTKESLQKQHIRFTETKIDENKVLVVAGYSEEDILDTRPMPTDVLAMGYDEEGNLVIYVQD